MIDKLSVKFKILYKSAADRHGLVEVIAADIYDWIEKIESLERRLETAEKTFKETEKLIDGACFDFGCFDCDCDLENHRFEPYFCNTNCAIYKIHELLKELPSENPHHHRQMKRKEESE